MVVLGAVLSGWLPAQTPDQQAAERVNRHALASLAGLLSTTTGNVCFSPFGSHRTASMLVEAAAGETRAELLRLTQLPEDAAMRQQLLRRLRDLMADLKSDADLTTAQSLWAAPGVVWNPTFEKSLRDLFDAPAFVLPEADAVEQARKVNGWVREQTQGRIADLVGPRMFENDAHSLMLVSTLRLAATWENRFDPSATRPALFHPKAGQTVEVPMMQQTFAAISYAEEAGAWQCLRLPLKGGLGVVFLLPANAEQQATIESSLTASVWAELCAQLRNRPVVVRLPRFEFTTRLDLMPLWEALGARTSFLPDLAQLPGLTQDQSPRFVRGVMHQATIEINEIGAQAAAATALGTDPFGSPSESSGPSARLFNADHPFLWYVHQEESDLILFCGRFSGTAE
ncbi:MAG: hypothetical protein KDK99_11010 [Verrucomicrobiales bacterium]|nr:hypothetical protein [Verrucomicrobiales bacterium]